MPSEELTRLARLVRDIADRELPHRFHCGGGARKADGSLVTEADLRMQAALAQALQREWPDHALLGEEMTEAEQRQALGRMDAGVWCIDPLDGTTNFAVGIPYYAVSVALLRQGRAELGVVYDPSRRECFAAARGQGAWLDERPLHPDASATPLSRAVALVDFKRLPAALATRLACEPPYQSQRSFGAGALDWCWLAAGRCHVYLHGKQKLWDYAAGSLVLSEAGGQAMTLAGESLFHAGLTPRSAVAALDAGLFREWSAWLGAGAAQGKPL